MPTGIFYFFAETKSANSHPTKVQPNIHEPTRTRILSYFEELFIIAKYAGVIIKHTNMNMTAAYFKISKILIPCHIFICRILPLFLILLRYESIDYILPCGQCVTQNPFLSVRHSLQQPNQQSQCLRFRHFCAK